MSDRSPNWLALFGAGLLALLVSLPAAAHRTSDSYLNLASVGDAVVGQWDIAIRDVELLAGVDADGNGAVTWGELKARLPAISSLALATLRIAADGKDCSLAPAPASSGITDHGGEIYAALVFRAQCEQASTALRIEYELLRQLDPSHRALVNLTLNGADFASVLAPGDAQTLGITDTASTLSSVARFFREGVHHILIGYDHIAFLLLLLLPSVLRREGTAWQAVDRPRAAIADMVKVVTAFTAAHSLTLALATLQLVNLPTQAVEMAIAASVLAAGLHNLYPAGIGRRWIVAFAFGLIHGFGFANVLGGLGLSGADLGVALVAFNVGVECGQLAIVLALLPLILRARHSRLYSRVALPAASVMIAAAGAGWFLERATGIPLLPV